LSMSELCLATSTVGRLSPSHGTSVYLERVGDLDALRELLTNHVRAEAEGALLLREDVARQARSAEVAALLEEKTGVCVS